MSSLSHIDSEGRAQMVDVSGKGTTDRTAVATGRVFLGEEAFQQVKDNSLKKGDVMTVAQIAGIMGAKHTSALIPLCHQVTLNGIDIELALDEAATCVTIQAFVKSNGLTGVEMEALTGVSVAALTVYDMCKSVSKDLKIGDIHLVAKTGGQSGDYLRRN